MHEPTPNSTPEAVQAAVQSSEDAIRDQRILDGKDTNTGLDQSGPKGLRGWLILIGLGMAFGPLRLLADFAKSLDETLKLDPSPIPGVDTVLALEHVGEVMIILLAISTSIAFFRKHHLFPRLFIALWLSPLVYTTVDWLGCSIVFAGYVTPGELLASMTEGPETAKALAQFVVAGLIWVPYVLFSKRVKNTFVKRGHNTGELRETFS